MPNGQESDQNKLIKKELNRMKKMFSSLPENERRFIEPLIQNAAFMRVTLEDLQNQISYAGCVEEYTNGKNQGGKKTSAELSAYNMTVRNYNLVMLKLIERLPKEQKASAMVEMMRKYG